MKLPNSREDASKKTRAQWDRAQDFCFGCPVMIECGRDFLGEPEGVFGGLDPIERHRLVFEHSQRVSNMEDGPERREYVALAWRLMKTSRVTVQDVQRIMGLRQSTVYHLNELHVKAVEAAKAAERAQEVTKKPPQAPSEPKLPAWPDRPPQEGDGWVRYGRTVVRGYYLGETRNGAWFHMKTPLSKEYSMAWFKADDVRLTRKLPRQIQERVGGPSRIYGTPISARRVRARRT